MPHRHDEYSDEYSDRELYQCMCLDSLRHDVYSDTRMNTLIEYTSCLCASACVFASALYVCAHVFTHSPSLSHSLSLFYFLSHAHTCSQRTYIRIHNSKVIRIRMQVREPGVSDLCYLQLLVAKVHAGRPHEHFRRMLCSLP